MKLRESVTIDEVIALLNEALEADREAINDLFEVHIDCNEQLLEHESIQVSDGSVGLLGILNGLFGVDANGWGQIAAVVEKGIGLDIVRFERVPSAIKSRLRYPKKVRLSSILCR